MSDGISNIKIIGPSYPVKPVQPAQKDRESGKRQKDPPKSESNSETEPDSENENTNQSSIDEYI